jgi:hypothetical protein
MLLDIPTICSLINRKRATVFRLLKTGEIKSKDIADVMAYHVKRDTKTIEQETINQLKEYGWLRRKPWPSKKALAEESGINPWKGQLDVRPKPGP